MKLKDVIAFKDLYDKKIQNATLNLDTAFKFAKLNAQLQVSIDIYQKQLEQVIKEYGEKDTNGNFVETADGVKIQADKLAECQAKLAQLVEIDSIDEINIKFDMAELHQLQLTVAELSILLPYIK